MFILDRGLIRSKALYGDVLLATGEEPGLDRAGGETQDEYDFEDDSDRTPFEAMMSGQPISHWRRPRAGAETYQNETVCATLREILNAQQAIGNRV